MAIVDDHPVVRDGMAALLREYPGIEIAGTAASLDLAEPLLDPALVDVLLLDIRLGEETGFQLLERHRDAGRRPAIVVLTAFAQAEYAAAAHRLGAAALVVKTAPMPELVAAIRAAALGEPVDGAPGPAATDPTLTTREQEIVRLVVEGRSNDEIGAALAIATKTVEGHLRRVFERLGIESRAELSARAVAEGWLDVPTVARRRGPGPTPAPSAATPLIGPRSAAARSARLARPELAIAGVAEARHDVALLVELAVERRAVDLDVGMRRRDRLDALRAPRSG